MNASLDYIRTIQGRSGKTLVEMDLWLSDRCSESAMAWVRPDTQLVETFAVSTTKSESGALLSEADLDAIERDFPAGITSVQVVEFFEYQGVTFHLVY